MHLILNLIDQGDDYISYAARNNYSETGMQMPVFYLLDF